VSAGQTASAFKRDGVTNPPKLWRLLLLLALAIAAIIWLNHYAVTHGAH